MHNESVGLTANPSTALQGKPQLTSIVGRMNREPADILAQALQQDASDQAQGQYEAIGEKWDAVYAEMLPIEEDIDNPVYGLAFRFRDDRGDAANHDWQYHEPTTRDMWLEYAREIASGLREGSLPRNEAILEQILPKPKESRFARTKRWWSSNA